MKIGELAQATNISVRTLHHYDEIGLLKPSSRTESGHRLYLESDIVQLHKILSLRNLGFTLEEVRQFIGHSAESLRNLLIQQSEKIEFEREELGRKQWCIQAAYEANQLPQYEGVENLTALIREFNIQSEYLSSEQRRLLQERNEFLGPDQLKIIHTKLFTLIERVQELMTSDVPPTDPRVLALANEWKLLGKESIGAASQDPAMAESYRRMLRDNPALASYRGITPELLDYLKASLPAEKEWVRQPPRSQI